jgi:hypothetical protein
MGEARKCERCWGSGRIVQASSHGARMNACPNCGGSGIDLAVGCAASTAGGGPDLDYPAPAPAPAVPEEGERQRDEYIRNLENSLYAAEARAEAAERQAAQWKEVAQQRINATLEQGVEAKARAEAAERERNELRERLAKLDGPHVLVLSDDRWTLEHSLPCWESGRMAECAVHARIAAWMDRVGEPDLAKGRYEVGYGELPAALSHESAPGGFDTEGER